jgi:hypothetical protein
MTIFSPAGCGFLKHTFDCGGIVFNCGAIVASGWRGLSSEGPILSRIVMAARSDDNRGWSYSAGVCRGVIVILSWD